MAQSGRATKIIKDGHQQVAAHIAGDRRDRAPRRLRSDGRRRRGGGADQVAAPPLTPAITEAEAKRTLARHMLTMNLAQKRLSVTVAAKAETGSALETRKAQYKIMRANKRRACTYKVTSALGASPRFNDY
jgi:hypothetical protein